MPKKILTPEQRAKSVAATKRWRQANKERMKEHNRRQRMKDPEATRLYTTQQTRSWVIRIKHGMSLEEYDAMLERQDYSCAICRSPTPGTSKSWRIDHCHVTSKVRGLLCHNCNVSLGLMKDNPASIRNMLAYLEGNNQ